MRLFALLLLLVCSAAAHAAGSVFGYWKTATGSVVRIAPCGASGDSNVCLKIVQLAASAPERTDRKNPDASLRGRALCGLTVGSGFHQDGPDRLSGGRLYDPKSGRDYSGTIALDGGDLKLHGYVGISLFGRTETWHRAPAGAGCS